jgi:hypothetical protein
VAKDQLDHLLAIRVKLQTLDDAPVSAEFDR